MIKPHGLLRVISSILFIMPLFLYATPVVVSGGPVNDYESWIARINDGRLMIIFDRNPDWASGDLYVTFSTDEGNSWDAPLGIIVEPDDQATLSFVQMPGDTFRVWYASNEDGQYGIYSAYSMDAISWTQEGRIALGWSLSDMHYDPTVVLEQDSSLTMSYVGPGGAYIAHCPYGGEWDTLRTIVAAGGYRPRIMKHSNGTYLFAYHRNIGSNQYEIHVRTSTDRITWSGETRLTFDGNSHDAFPYETPDNGYLVYYATYHSPAYNLYRRRSFNTTVWEPEEQITFDAFWNTQPHFFIESENIYLVWAHATTSSGDTYDVYFERFPYVVGITETDPIATSISASISPNPCSNRMHVHLITKHAGDVALSVYDITGQRIPSCPIFDTQQDACFILDTSRLRTGTYFLKVQNSETAVFTKFVVAR
jgi:hypothetical protein